jgi:hypothetical protein
MGRQRSIIGLVLHLAQLHARRRPCGWVVIATVLSAVLAIAVLHRALVQDASRAGDRTVAAAVLRDGFALITPAGLAHRVVELDAQGVERRALQVEPRGEIRVVGARAGTLVGWRAGRNVLLARAGDDRETSRWGRSVRQLCEGFASSDVRFAIGWLEADDTVWIVHGPVAGKAAASGEAAPDEAANNDAGLVAIEVAARDALQPAWCGIASAEHNVAMLWRDGSSLHLTMCDKRRCGPLPARFQLPASHRIVGFGCLRAACLIATRVGTEPTRFSYVTNTGKQKWAVQRPIESPHVAILGIGDRAFAVGLLGTEGAEILRIDRDGKTTSLWRDPAATSVPSLAWSGGKLMIARYHGAALRHDVIAAPR